MNTNSHINLDNDIKVNNNTGNNNLSSIVNQISDNNNLNINEGNIIEGRNQFNKNNNSKNNINNDFEHVSNNNNAIIGSFSTNVNKGKLAQTVLNRISNLNDTGKINDCLKYLMQKIESIETKVNYVKLDGNNAKEMYLYWENKVTENTCLVELFVEKQILYSNRFENSLYKIFTFNSYFYLIYDINNLLNVYSIFNNLVNLLYKRI